MSNQLWIFIGTVFVAVVLLSQAMIVPVFGEGRKTRKKLKARLGELEREIGQGSFSSLLREKYLRELSPLERVARAVAVHGSADRDDRASGPLVSRASPRARWPAVFASPAAPPLGRSRTMCSSRCWRPPWLRRAAVPQDLARPHQAHPEDRGAAPRSRRHDEARAARRASLQRRDQARQRGARGAARQGVRARPSRT